MIEVKLNEIETTGYQFKMGEYLNRGFEIFKKNPGGFIGYTVLFMVISIGISFIPAVGSMISIVVSPPLTVGFYIMAKKLSNDEPTIFNDFFAGFSGNIGQMALVSLIGSILSVLAMILLILPGIYLAIGYSFALFLVYFKSMEFWPALEASRKIVSKNWFSFFGFFLVILLLNLAGAIVLGVGLFVTVPVSYCAMYAAFDDIVGVKDGSEEEAISDHLIVG